MSESYVGPATLILSREEWLTVIRNLQLIPTAENGELRRRIEDFIARTS